MEIKENKRFRYLLGTSTAMLRDSIPLYVTSGASAVASFSEERGDGSLRAMENQDPTHMLSEPRCTPLLCVGNIGENG